MTIGIFADCLKILQERPAENTEKRVLCIVKKKKGESRNVENQFKIQTIKLFDFVDIAAHINSRNIFI